MEMMETSESSLYWAVPGFQKDLKSEYEAAKSDHKIIADWGHILWIDGPPMDLAWSQNSWHRVGRAEIPSIGGAARFLSSKADRWIAGSVQQHRRAQLILENLKGFPKHWRNFRENLNHENWGGFCQLDERNILVSLDIHPKLPLEGPSWLEDKTAPSRAYLKLWEVFYRTGHFPKKDERCFELGASPGGWTWVLRKLGARVWATDRADLSPELMADPFVHFQKGDGFQIKRESLPEMDWVFSDVICYPDKLWEWVQMWMEAPKPPKMVCTLKFQADTDFATQAKFAAVPNSKLMHLFQNKHELTWVWMPEGF